MTLVMTVNGRESIWMLADRRLSFRTRVLRDDARKIMFLETKDGVAILGYAGLGATALGSEPADWMSAVLRGRNLLLEQSLSVLAEALKRQFPRHMVRMSGEGGPAHHVLITAFLCNETRFYTIDLVFAPDRKGYYFRYTRHFIHMIDKPTSPTTWPPQLALGGTGAQYLMRDKKWIRPLLRLAKAYDRGQVSSHEVVDHLVHLNNEVHLGTTNKSVGPRCIVAWRHRKEGIHKGGGGHKFYTGATRDASSSPLPTIARGMDVTAIVGMTMPHVAKMFEAVLSGKPENELDKDKLNADLALLPGPDENFR